ncbi:MAG: ABC transporter permease [Alphaproteobacteria bacterium]|jgi:peptide/nickel transport system permease protein|nr:ABC transporter permease [Alphaproteobacteria bacterium]
MASANRRRLSRAARQVAGVAFTLFGLLVVTFVIGRVIPIDPVLAVVGDRASAETYAAAEAAMGLDRSLAVQFGLYIQGILSGDFGTSVVTTRPVAADIARYFPATMELATIAILIGIALGVPAGVLAASKRGRWPDHVVRVVSLLGYSTPAFWLGMIVLLVFYATLGWAAGPGRIDVYYVDIVTPVTGLLLIDSALDGEWEILRNALSHLALPALVLGGFSVAYIARMTRSLMVEQLSQEYVLAARAKGMSEARVVWRHALANAAVPLVTVVALSYGALLEGSVLTETVFAWPGLGSYLTNSLLNADMNAVLGSTLVIGVVFLGLNLLADLLYTWLDPRVS